MIRCWDMMGRFAESNWKIYDTLELLEKTI